MFNQEATGMSDNGYFGVEIYGSESKVISYVSVDDANFSCVSAADSGANEHCHYDRKDFCVYRKLDVPIKITVARKGVTMLAVGKGDRKLLTKDSDGKPVCLLLKDCLHVPEATKSLISVNKLGAQGYQCVFPAARSNFEAGVYQPKRAGVESRRIPFQQVNGLFYIPTRVGTTDGERNLTGSTNPWIKAHHDFGYMPLSAIRHLKKVSTGLESLNDAVFPTNFVPRHAIAGKLTNIDQPALRPKKSTRCLAGVHWDTFGPFKTQGIKGESYATVFVDDYSNYYWTAVHKSTGDIPAIFKRFVAMNATLIERHGPIGFVRRDNASVNVSKRVMDLLDNLGIQSQTSCPYQPYMNWTAESAVKVLTTMARCVINATGVPKNVWTYAVRYAAQIHNWQYAENLGTSPHVLMFGEKPDLSTHRAFGVECWMYNIARLRSDQKLDPRGLQCVCLGYAPEGQVGYAVLNFTRKPAVVCNTTNLMFTDVFPLSKLHPCQILSDSNEMNFAETPKPFDFEQIAMITEATVCGTFGGDIVLSTSCKGSPVQYSTVPCAQWVNLLSKCMQEGMTEVCLSLADTLDALTESQGTDEPEIHGAAQHADVPRNLAEALSQRFATEYGPALQKEMQGFVEHECFEQVDLPEGRRCLPTQILFSRKSDGTPKVRFVIGGHMQQEGRDFHAFKNYCGVLSSRDNRLMLAVAAVEGWEISQTDISQAFLEGKLDDVDVFIRAPPGYPCAPGKVLQLKRAVYGLRQAPVKFKKEVTDWFKAKGYIACNAAETIWMLKGPSGIIIHTVYVDDFLHFYSNRVLYEEFKTEFSQRFQTKSGEVSRYLGNNISKIEGRVTLDQKEYIDTMLEKFGMNNSNTVKTPMVERLTKATPTDMKLGPKQHENYRSLIGCLLYVAVWSRPDIAYAVSELSRFVSEPFKVHWQAAKYLLRYLGGTRDVCLSYSSGSKRDNVLWGYCDSDWAGDVDSRKSTTGYVLMLNGGAVAWKSKRQPLVAMSTAEAEYIAASLMVQELIYMRRLLDVLGFPQPGPSDVFEDNRTAIAWSEGAVGGSDRAKHIDIRRFFLQEAVANGVVSLKPIASEDNLADLLTKPLLAPRVTALRSALMGRSM